MSNPWIRRNPLLSMWLSGVHTVAAAAQHRLRIEARRNATAAVNAAALLAADFCKMAMTPAVPENQTTPKKKTQSRRVKIDRRQPR